MVISKAKIHQFYFATKSHRLRLAQSLNMKFFRRRRAQKRDDELFTQEREAFIGALPPGKESILVSLINILTYFNCTIENVYEIFGTLGFELTD